MQFGVGVVVHVEGHVALREFVFSHYALVEAHLHALQRAVSEVLGELLRDAAQRPDVSIHTLPSVLSTRTTHAPRAAAVSTDRCMLMMSGRAER
jgi:hypothetical protein